MIDTTKSADTRMTAKQLASTVRQGRRLTIGVLDEEPLTGYLAGWDNEGYLLVFAADRIEGQDVAKVIVPKSSILYYELYDKRSFREEVLYEEMDKIVKPFRDYINNTYFKL